MLESGKSGSMESLEWLQWHQARCTQGVIKHAYNFGEVSVAGHKVDGYVEIKSGQSVWKCAFQYMGCYWHYCRWQCRKSRATIEDAIKDQQVLAQISQEVDEVIVTTSCEWAAEKRRFKLQSPDYCFLGQKVISEDEIFSQIHAGNFYGIIRCDVHTPPSVISEYEHLNFPFIFRKMHVTEEMLSESMKNLAKKVKKEFPAETRTLTWNAQDIVLTTPTVQFYMQLGMKISNLRWAVQYKRSEPFKKFVKGMVDIRIDAKKTGNNPLGERAKFCLNSCVGRFGLVQVCHRYFYENVDILIIKVILSLNSAKHRNTTFVAASNERKHTKSPLLVSCREISSEYKIPLLEIVKKKRNMTDKIPVHIS